MKVSKLIHTICFISLTMMYIACGDGPVSASDVDYIQNRTKDDYNYKKSSTSRYTDNTSDYYSSLSQRYSSSSRETYSNSSIIVFDYLTTSKTIHFTLTYYEQLTYNWDLSSHSLTDGDPRISFILHFIQPNGTETSYSTSTNLGSNWFYKEDTGKWEGSLSFTATVPALTDTIKICPSVVDVDVLLYDNMSSGYCYWRSHVGRVKDYDTFYDSDYSAKNYSLKWEWYLY